jgi:hypothetical protein
MKTLGIYRKRKFVGLFVFAAAMCGCHLNPPEYGLPITLGSSSADIRHILGSPDESFKSPADERLTVEWYYSHGLVVDLERDQVVTIQIPPDIADYRGFLPYTGPIVRGLKLTDSKAKYLKTLGEPAKIENDALTAGTNPDIPVVWPKESIYYWRLPEYMVRVDFLNQAQDISEAKHITLPRDTVTTILIRR